MKTNRILLTATLCLAVLLATSCVNYTIRLGQGGQKIKPSKNIVEKVYGKQNDESGKGILFCSGLIAGEGILGIVLAILTVAGVTDKINISSFLPTGNITSLIVLAAIGAVVFFMAGGGKKISGKKKNAK